MRRPRPGSVRRVLRRSPRTRRAALARRTNDFVGQVSWSITRELGHGFYSQISPTTKRWSKVAGASAGAATAATAAALAHHRRRRPA